MAGPASCAFFDLVRKQERPDRVLGEPGGGAVSASRERGPASPFADFHQSGEKGDPLPGLTEHQSFHPRIPWLVLGRSGRFPWGISSVPLMSKFGNIFKLIRLAIFNHRRRPQAGLEPATNCLEVRAYEGYTCSIAAQGDDQVRRHFTLRMSDRDHVQCRVLPAVSR